MRTTIKTLFGQMRLDVNDSIRISYSTVKITLYDFDEFKAHKLAIVLGLPDKEFMNHVGTQYVAYSPDEILRQTISWENGLPDESIFVDYDRPINQFISIWENECVQNDTKFGVSSCWRVSISGENAIGLQIIF